MKLFDLFEIEIDEEMSDNEVLLKFPEGQEYKNIRIINIGSGEEAEQVYSATY